MAFYCIKSIKSALAQALTDLESMRYGIVVIKSIKSALAQALTDLESMRYGILLHQEAPIMNFGLKHCWIWSIT